MTCHPAGGLGLCPGTERIGGGQETPIGRGHEASMASPTRGFGDAWTLPGPPKHPDPGPLDPLFCDASYYFGYFGVAPSFGLSRPV